MGKTSRSISSYSSFQFHDHLQYIKTIVQNDGPDPHEYQDHLQWYSALNASIAQGQITEPQRDKLRHAFGASYSVNTLQGYVYQWPLGYAGDFQVIEKIYDGDISPDPRFAKYDRFFQCQDAPVAVRNRKQYFKRLIREACDRTQGLVRVLNIASGPCREIKELFDESPDLPATFLCVEIDEAAIAYARKLLGDHVSKVEFVAKNVFRYKPSQTFSLIWSAGLFDYFDDKAFHRILSRFVPALQEEAEVVVGNFGETNTTRGYMEAIGKWYLHHRSDSQLKALAKLAGASSQHQIAVGYEPTGVNRFLHIARTAKSLRIDLPHLPGGPSISEQSDAIGGAVDPS